MQMCVDETREDSTTRDIEPAVPFGRHVGARLDLLNVAIATAIASFLGWASLAIIEWITTRARVAWIVVALLGLLISLGAPLSGTGVTSGDRVTLVLMHLTTGGVLILGLARTVGTST